MEKQYSEEFFSNFIDNTQKLCRNLLDFDQVCEVSGYVCVTLDNSKQERYVLSEMIHDSGNVMSESYCTKVFRTMPLVRNYTKVGRNTSQDFSPEFDDADSMDSMSDNSRDSIEGLNYGRGMNMDRASMRSQGNVGSKPGAPVQKRNIQRGQRDSSNRLNKDRLDPNMRDEKNVGGMRPGPMRQFPQESIRKSQEPMRQNLPAHTRQGPDSANRQSVQVKRSAQDSMMQDRVISRNVPPSKQESTRPTTMKQNLPVSSAQRAQESSKQEGRIGMRQEPHGQVVQHPMRRETHQEYVARNPHLLRPANIQQNPPIRQGQQEHRQSPQTTMPQGGQASARQGPQTMRHGPQDSMKQNPSNPVKQVGQPQMRNMPQGTMRHPQDSIRKGPNAQMHETYDDEDDEDFDDEYADDDFDPADMESQFVRRGLQGKPMHESRESFREQGQKQPMMRDNRIQMRGEPEDYDEDEFYDEYDSDQMGDEFFERNVRNKPFPPDADKKKRIMIDGKFVEVKEEPDDDYLPEDYKSEKVRSDFEHEKMQGKPPSQSLKLNQDKNETKLHENIEIKQELHDDDDDEYFNQEIREQEAKFEQNTMQRQTNSPHGSHGSQEQKRVMVGGQNIQIKEEPVDEDMEASQDMNAGDMNMLQEEFFVAKPVGQLKSTEVSQRRKGPNIKTTRRKIVDPLDEPTTSAEKSGFGTQPRKHVKLRQPDSTMDDAAILGSSDKQGEQHQQFGMFDPADFPHSPQSYQESDDSYETGSQQLSSEIVEVDMDAIDDEGLAAANSLMLGLSHGTTEGSAMQSEPSKKYMTYSINLFSQYQKEKGYSEPIHLIPPQKLDSMLTDFLENVRKNKKSEEFEAHVLKSIHANLHTFLQDQNYPYSIMDDIVFAQSREKLKNKLESQRGTMKNISQIDSLTEYDVKTLFQEKQLGDHSASVLLNTMWFMNNMFLGVKGPAQHQNLKWGDIALLEDDSGKEFLRYSSSRKAPKTIVEPLYATPDQPDQCFVNLYKVYRDRRHSDLLQTEAAFYSKENRIQGSMPWFVPEQLSPSRLKNIMQKMAKAAGFPPGKRFTNSSSYVKSTPLNR